MKGKVRGPSIHVLSGREWRGGRDLLGKHGRRASPTYQSALLVSYFRGGRKADIKSMIAR